MLLVLGCLWAVLQAVPARAAEVTLCADVWCPYNCQPNSRSPGLAVEIAQGVFGPAGDHVVYEELNWARCIEDARAGRFTAIIGAIHTDAPDFVFPATPIGVSGDAYAVRAGDPFHFDGERSMSGRVLGVIRSYTFSGSIGAYVAEHGTDGRVEFVSGSGALRKNLEKLVAGRVDVVLDDENVLRDAVADLGLDRRVRLDRGPNRTPIYIAFSPAPVPGGVLPRTLVRMFDEGMGRLRASGQLARIMAAYHVADAP